jgi:hypothetical protein
MRYLGIVSILSLIWLASACSTDNRGGANANYDAFTGSEEYPSQPSSPSQRPGMRPEDPRDPQFITRPQPSEPPPTTKP